MKRKQVRRQHHRETSSVSDIGQKVSDIKYFLRTEQINNSQARSQLGLLKLSVRGRKGSYWTKQNKRKAINDIIVPAEIDLGTVRPDIYDVRTGRLRKRR